MDLEIKSYLNRQKLVVEEHLSTMFLQEQGVFAEHIKAMRYSLFVGGKRVRPILCLASAEAVSDDSTLVQKALPTACALECIHTYSLIHDDLPAMDDDELRRGKPTNHTIFGEAGAILAGDGLLSFAFELLSGPLNQTLEAETCRKVIHQIAHAAGSEGMVGGQSLDMLHEGKLVSLETLQEIHRSKTGALITASCVSGGLIANASQKQLEALNDYGNNIGLAFQIADDILDIESTTEELGKPVGSDLASEKVTYPSLVGLDQAKKKAREAVDRAHHALSKFTDKADPLRELATYIIERKN